MSRTFPPQTPEQHERDEAFRRLIAESAAAYKALSPVDRAIADVRQRQSWVRGEMMLEHMEMSAEEAQELVSRDPAVVLADEVERLRALLAQNGTNSSGTTACLSDGVGA